MAHQVRRHRTAAETLLPAAVALTDDNQVTLVVTNHLEKRSTRFTVKNVHGHIVTKTLELLAVGVHALHSLVTKLPKELVLLLTVDGQGTRHPRTAEHIGRQNSGKEDVAVLRTESMLTHDVVESQVTSFSTVNGKKNLELIVRYRFTGVTNNLLVASLRGDRQLIKGVTRLHNGGLGNIVHGGTGSDRATSRSLVVNTEKVLLRVVRHGDDGKTGFD